MGDIHFVLQRDVFFEDNEKIENMHSYAQSKGWMSHQFTHFLNGFINKTSKDYNSSINKIVDEIPQNSCVVAYVSLEVAKFIQRRTSWIPGIWCDLKKLRCQDYFPYFGSYLLTKNYAMMPMAEVIRKKDWLFDTFGNNKTIFIRPDENDKRFHGGVVKYADFERWHKTAQIYNDDPSSLCVIGEVEAISEEYRLIVSDKKIIAATSYSFEDEEFKQGCPSQVKNYAEKALTEIDWQPYPIYTVDVAVSDNKDIRIVEIGSVNTSCIYEARFKPIMDAMVGYAQKEWKELI